MAQKRPRGVVILSLSETFQPFSKVNWNIPTPWMLCSEVKVQSFLFLFFLPFPAETFVEIVIISQKALCALNCVRDDNVKITRDCWYWCKCSPVPVLAVPAMTKKQQPEDLKKIKSSYILFILFILQQFTSFLMTLYLKVSMCRSHWSVLLRSSFLKEWSK